MKQQNLDPVGVVTVDEHVRSNLGYALGVLAAAIVTIALVMTPLFSTSGWLVAARWILVVVAACMIPVAVVELLNYFRRRLVLDAVGVSYTDCLGRTTSYAWDEVLAYDIREKQNSVMLVMGGKRRTFHKSSHNFDRMVDYLMDHTGLISTK